MNVLVPLAEGVEELEAITIIDVLRRAGIAVTTAALTEDTLVKGSQGVIIKADTILDELNPDEFGAIVLPGGGGGTDNMLKDSRIVQTVQGFKEEGNMSVPSVLPQPCWQQQACWTISREPATQPAPRSWASPTGTHRLLPMAILLQVRDQPPQCCLAWYWCITLLAKRPPIKLPKNY